MKIFFSIFCLTALRKKCQKYSKKMKRQRSVLMATVNSYTSKDGSQFRGTEYATTCITKQDFVDRIIQVS